MIECGYEVIIPKECRKPYQNEGWVKLETAAASGLGNIRTKVFANMFNLLCDDARVAFNIKDRFLSADDDTGFADTFNRLLDDGFNMIESRRYQHRLSPAGEPLHYYVIVGRKTSDISLN